MIEFKGKYYQNTKATAVDALIQHDGVLLHVWHLSDPFHRLFSSDEFHLNRSIFKNETILKLPNGGRVETDDNQALMQLAHNQNSGNCLNQCALIQNWVFMLMGSITLMLAALWMIKNGLLF